MYVVRTIDRHGETVRGPKDFERYSDANRYAIEHASLCEGHITFVESSECAGLVQVAYVSLSEVKHGKVSMVDDCCCEPIAELPAYAEQTIAWFRERKTA